MNDVLRQFSALIVSGGGVPGSPHGVGEMGTFKKQNVLGFYLKIVK